MEFTKNKVECNIVIQKTSNESKENAEKYNIIESKASFIEEIIKENDELNFEDLKDKSIKELNEIKEENNETKEEIKEENEKVTTPTTMAVTKPVVKPATPAKKPSALVEPSDPRDTSGVWCTWNENKPQGTYYMDAQMDQEIVHKQVLEHLGLTSWGSTIGDYSGAVADVRSSYCIAYRFIITTNEKEYLILTDSVTGKIIEETYTLTPQPKYSEEEAINILLRYNNVLKEDTTTIYPSYGKDRDGYANGAIYRYSISINMKDGTRYNGSVNAMTGEIYNTRTEKY